jgi:hypothetical protein
LRAIDSQKGDNSLEVCQVGQQKTPVRPNRECREKLARDPPQIFEQAFAIPLEEVVGPTNTVNGGEFSPPLVACETPFGKFH